jgi:hypothetical protein
VVPSNEKISPKKVIKRKASQVYRNPKKRQMSGFDPEAAQDDEDAPLKNSPPKQKEAQPEKSLPLWEVSHSPSLTP